MRPGFWDTVARGSDATAPSRGHRAGRTTGPKAALRFAGLSGLWAAGLCMCRGLRPPSPALHTPTSRPPAGHPRATRSFLPNSEGRAASAAGRTGYAPFLRHLPEGPAGPKGQGHPRKPTRARVSDPEPVPCAPPSPPVAFSNPDPLQPFPGPQEPPWEPAGRKDGHQGNRVPHATARDRGHPGGQCGPSTPAAWGLPRGCCSTRARRPRDGRAGRGAASLHAPSAGAAWASRLGLSQNSRLPVRHRTWPVNLTDKCARTRVCVHCMCTCACVSPHPEHVKT